MKIFTSYFGISKKIPKDWYQVAICGKMMFPFSGFRYPKLAPKIGFFKEWKKSHDNDYYTAHYKAEVLSSLTPNLVREELSAMVNDSDATVVLMCYETPDKFCHRHIVAEWLGDVIEYTP